MTVADATAACALMLLPSHSACRPSAVLNLLIGIALVLLASAMFDHQNMEFDLTWAVAAAVGFYCILRGLVLFWVR